LDDLVEMYRDDTPDLTNITITDEQPNILEEDGIAAEKYVNMLRVHSRGGEKYNVVSIFIDDVVFQKAPEAFKTKVVLPILTSLPDLTIASAHQSLHISSADFEVARQLEIPVNTPTAEIRRVLCDPKGRVIYIVDATYRGDYIRLDMNLKS
jgi:GntR family transcriptional regulator